MTVATIIDNEAGRKTEIIKEGKDLYTIKYYEYFQQIGWRLTDSEENYSKDCIECEFDIQVA